MGRSLTDLPPLLVHWYPDHLSDGRGPLLLRRAQAEREDVGDWSLKRPGELGAVGRLKRNRHFAAEEFTYLRARTSRTAKITLPSPGLFANFWPEKRSVDAYPTLADFLADPGCKKSTPRCTH